MANGDIAAGAGMPIVAATGKVRLGYDEINLSRDLIATYAARSGPLIDIHVGPSAPAHKSGRIWIKTG